MLGTPQPAPKHGPRRRVALFLAFISALAWSIPLIATPASADTIAATIVRSTELKNAFSPPSPDPAGLAFVPPSTLLISDSEVEEMPPYWANVNVWRTTLAGAVVGTPSGNTTAYAGSFAGMLNKTNEPAGLAYDSSAPGTRPTSGHLFVSDDVTVRIHEVAPGTDGVIGTGDDTVVRVINAAAYGAVDAEDVAFDSARGDLYIAEGIKAEVWRISPGPNGQFDGTDDVSTHFDIAAFGAEDTEGIGFDEVRDTLLVADRNTRTIYEVHRAGVLLNRITLPTTINHPADVVIAPASGGGGGRNYYVVARGVDNDQDPLENDGMLFELSAQPPAITNVAPQVDAGPNQGITLPGQATLSGLVADEDLGSVTTLWEQTSGPGTATITSPTALSTTVGFPVTGTYVFRLTATDGQTLSASDQVTVYAATEGTTVLRRPVSIGYDDAEEGQNGKVALGGSDLELVNDGATLGDQTVGVRFQNITVPRNTDVTNAYIQFQTDRVTTNTTNLLVQAQAADNAPRFTTATGNISTRPRLGGVTWGPVPPWNVPGAATENERTPNLEPLVQALVNRANWRSGNAMAFIITGTGKRAAESFNGQAAPILQVEYADGSGNEPPMVSAGPDRQVTLPNGLTLNGSASDDGKPIPPGAFTVQWSQLDGPQSVEFSNETSPTTGVTFTESGTYLLRLTASDGIEVTTDDVMIVVASNTSTGVLNLVTNPSFESGTTGWNTAGAANIVLDRTSPGHNGSSFAARLTNNNSQEAECKLNDQPDTVSSATAGTYTASLWAMGVNTMTLRLRIREYLSNGTTNVLTQNLTLSPTEWRQVTVSKAVQAGSKIDLQAWIANAPAGVCFLADDVILTRT